MRSDPAIAAAILWALWALSWLAAAAFTNATKVRTPMHTLLAVRLLAVCGGILMFLAPRAGARLSSVEPFTRRLWPSFALLDWTLVVLTGAAFGFCWWARLHLGRLWSSAVTLKEGHRLVDDGPYGWVRHPIYAGLQCAAVATALTEASFAALAGACLMIIAFTRNALVEEAFLREQLGAASYDAYARRVGMLIPKPGR